MLEADDVLLARFSFLGLQREDFPQFFELQFQPFLMLTRVPRRRLQHTLVAAHHLAIVLFFDFFDDLLLLEAERLVLS